VFKINNKDQTEKTSKHKKEGIDVPNKNDDKSEKIETCYFCLQKFDINKDDCSHYKYGKFPMCDYCSQFYGFYEENLKKEE
jgi:hypothetical protein